MDFVSVPDWLVYTVIIVIVLYLYATWTHDHFKKRSIPFLKPMPFVGNVLPMLLKHVSVADMVLINYNKAKKHRICGMFEFTNPLLMITDPNVMRTVCVKEFDHFMNHRQTINDAIDPIFSKNLFALTDKRWKDMRSTLSPVFTSSKMKNAFVLVSECGRQTAEYLEKQCREREGGVDEVLSLEMKDFYTRFTTDVIATFAFGVKCDSLQQPKNEFYMMGKDITNFNSLRNLVFLIYVLIPKLATLFKISFFSKQSERFFKSIIHETITTREREGIIRPDLINLLMEARRENNTRTTNGLPKTKLEEDDITAQAVLFFFAGFETSANLICFVTYLLCVHPEIQRKLHKEIDTTLETEGITYETVHKMKYLDMVVSETLRLYPPAPVVDRQCKHSFTIPASDTEPEVTFRKGDIIWLPLHGFHHDPRYFPEPEKFDPERFSDENKHNIKPFTYVPFGSGPRVCLAQRFALMEAKVALVHLLSRFSIHAIDKTPIPMKLARKGFNTTSEKGFWCGVKLRSP